MRPWQAVWRGKTWSNQRRTHPGLTPPSRATVEPLEERRLFSAALSGSFAEPLPASLPPAGADARARVTVRVANQGDSPTAGPFTVNLYASSDLLWDAGDAFLAGKTVPSAPKPGRQTSVRLGVQTPASLPAGDYYLLARIDGPDPTGTSGGAAPEVLSPAVVASPAPVAVQPPFVDLTARITELPDRPVEVGGRHGPRVAVEVTNLGNVTVNDPVELRLYLSADTKLDTADAALAVIPARRLNLRPGQSKTVTARVSAMPQTQPGLYYVLAVVDSAGAIAESNEANNLAASAAPVSVVLVRTGRWYRDRYGHRYYGENDLLYFGGSGYGDYDPYTGVYYGGDGYYFDDYGGYPPDLPYPNDVPPPYDGGVPAPEPPATEPAPRPSTQPSTGPSTLPADDTPAPDPEPAPEPAPEPESAPGPEPSPEPEPAPDVGGGWDSSGTDW